MKVTKAQQENFLRQELPKLFSGCKDAQNRLAYTHKRQLWAATDSGLFWCNTEICKSFKKAVLAEHKFSRGKHGKLLEGVRSLRPNRDGRFLALVSDIGLQVLQLPRSTGSAAELVRIVDTTEFRSGQRILQAEWHPGTDRHLCLLTDTDEFRLYYVREGHLSLDSSHSLQVHSGRADPVVGFSFSEVDAAWDQFSIYFARASGELELLCPVVPRNLVKLQDALYECQAGTPRLGASRANARSWLRGSWRRPRSESVAPGFDPTSLQKVVVYHGSQLDTRICPQPVSIQPRQGPPSEGSTCVGLQAISVPSSAASGLRPSVLLKLWSTGETDVVAVLEPCSPCWERVRGVLSGISLHRLPHRPSPAPWAWARAVQLGASSDVYLIAPDRVAKLMLPWASRMADELTEEGMSDFMSRVSESTSVTQEHAGQRHGYALLRGVTRDCFSLVLAGHAATEVLRPVLRDTLPAPLAIASSAPEAPDLSTPALAEMFGEGFRPFSELLEPFEQKFNPAFLQSVFGQAISHCSQQQFDINCPASVQWFFANVRDKISPLFEVQDKLKNDMYTRLCLFDDIVEAQQGLTEDLELQLKELEAASAQWKVVLADELRKMKENVELVDNILAEFSVKHSGLSSAEKQFGQHITKAEQETRLIEDQLRSLPSRSKLEQMAAQPGQQESTGANAGLVNQMLGPLKDQNRLVQELKLQVKSLVEEAGADLSKIANPEPEPPARSPRRLLAAPD